MAENQDVTFNFDPKSFLAGLDKIVAGLDTLQTKTEETAEKISGTITNNFDDMGKKAKKSEKTIESFGKKGAAVVNNMLTKVAALGFSFLALRKAVAFIPEIGRTWFIVSNIFLQNFLFPLRKLLMPMLQQILDWTRNNRALFARWGAVVASAFKVVIALAKTMFKLVRAFTRGAFKVLEELFGKTVSNIEKTLTLLTAKMAIAATALGIVLQPVFETLGKIIGRLIDFGKAFVQGFIEGFGKVQPILNGLKRLFAAISNLFATNDKELKYFRDTIRDIGRIFGKIVNKALTKTIWLLTKFFKLLKKFQAVGKVVGGFIGKNIAKEYGFGEFGQQNRRQQFSLIRGGALRRGSRTFQFEGNKYSAKTGRRVRDAIITKKGEVVETHPNDTLIAMQKMIPSAKTKEVNRPVSISVNVGGVSITTGQITQENAMTVGQGIGDNISMKLRNLLFREMELRGAV